ncbi:MAG: 6-hydroxymethylpterin diphosphokinase MptE-like protein [Candidatus Bathyarchaeia archaeon]
MNLSVWLTRYREIVRKLSLSWDKDQEAADLLSSLLDEDFIPLERVREAVSGRNVLVFGAGPSLVQDLLSLIQNSILDRFCLITADGATSALIKQNIRPNLIVTDLDGNIEDQIHASKEGSIVIIHAHGDNIPALTKYVSKFHNRLGSTQVEPRKGVYNFGGFTDGDRAVFMSISLGAKTLTLAGMDFGSEIGEYSKPKPYSKEMKVEKLHVGLELLEWLSTNTLIPLYNITAGGIPIRGFRKVTVDELRRLI